MVEHTTVHISISTVIGTPYRRSNLDQPRCHRHRLEASSIDRSGIWIGSSGCSFTAVLKDQEDYRSAGCR